MPEQQHFFERANENFLKIDQIAGALESLRLGLKTDVPEQFSTQLSKLLNEIEQVYGAVEETDQVPTGKRTVDEIFEDSRNLISSAVAHNYIAPVLYPESPLATEKAAIKNLYSEMVDSAEEMVNKALSKVGETGKQFQSECDQWFLQAEDIRKRISSGEYLSISVTEIEDLQQKGINLANRILELNRDLLQ